MKLNQRIAIYGQVQGVNFRAALAHEAKRLGLGGWVRNRREGWVEAQLQGEPLAVAELISWAKRGPPAARVSHVEVFDLAQAEDYADFQRLPSV